MAESKKHIELKNVAIRWLYDQGCWLFAKEVGVYEANAIADALGVKRNGDIYFVEAKATARDLRARKQRWMQNSIEHAPVADFYYFILANGVTFNGEDLEHYWHWGIINESGKVIKKAKRIIPDAKFDRERIIQHIPHKICLAMYNDIIFG